MKPWLRSWSRRACLTVLAHTGREALGLIESMLIHAVVLDTQMPQLGGLQVIRLMRERPNAPPAILLTNHLTNHLLREALGHAGFQRDVQAGGTESAAGRLGGGCCGDITRTAGRAKDEVNSCQLLVASCQQRQMTRIQLVTDN